MSKTIQEMADEYVGHSKEISEDSCITAKRESFKQGANAVLKEIESIAFSDIGSYKSILDKIQNKIKQLKGEQL